MLITRRHYLHYRTAARHTPDLGCVSSGRVSVSLRPEISLGGVQSTSGDLDMIWVIGVLFAGFGIGAVIFYSAGRSKRVHQLDNYAGGHFLTTDVRYQYSDNFYSGLMHLISGWYRGSFSVAGKQYYVAG